MRLVVMLLTLLALLLAPASQAQVSSYAFDLSLHTPMEAVAPGNATMLSLEAIRVCSAPGQVLDQQTAEIVILQDGDATVAGPSQVIFEQQVCAVESHQSVAASYTIIVPRNTTEDVLQFRLVLRPGPMASPSVGGSGNEAAQDFAIGVARPVAMAAAETEPEELEAPMMPSALLAIALLASAFALRRRA